MHAELCWSLQGRLVLRVRGERAQTELLPGKVWWAEALLSLERGQNRPFSISFMLIWR